MTIPCDRSMGRPSIALCTPDEERGIGQGHPFPVRGPSPAGLDHVTRELEGGMDLVRVDLAWA
jgi:hypothetical protein